MFPGEGDNPALKPNPSWIEQHDGFSSSWPEWPIASWATISVIISRIPNGDKHRFVNYYFPFPKPDDPCLNSVATRDRHRVKRQSDDTRGRQPHDESC